MGLKYRFTRFFVWSVVAVVFAGCLPEGGRGLSVSKETEDAEIPKLSEEEELLNEVIPILRGDQVENDNFSVILDSDVSEFVQVPLISKNIQVTAGLKFERAYEMRFISGKGCDQGTWQKYTDQVVLTIQEPNAKNVYSIQVRDPDLLESQCETFAIIHDNLGPEILFRKYPTASVEEGDRPILLFDLDDQSGVKSEIKCTLNDVVVDCRSGVELELPNAELQDYVFVVEAKDELDNVSSSEVTWSGTVKLYNKNLNIQVTDQNKVDILFVIDNSGSMSYEQQNMANRLSNFISHLSGLDWRIGVTTTDPRTNIALGDGQLIPIVGGTNGQYIIDQSATSIEAQTLLGNTLQRPESGSGYEQGIRATYRMIQRSFVPDSKEAMLVRPDAAFATIVISDEDETGNSIENDPQELLSLISNTYGGQKNFTFHSIITIPEDSTCLNGEGYTYGWRYQRLSRLTGSEIQGGSIIGSVCEADYGNQLSGIGLSVKNMRNSVTLSCEPVGTVTVVKDGQSYGGTFLLDGVKMVFSDYLEAGSYDFNYYCLE